MTEALRQFLDKDTTGKIAELTPIKCLGNLEEIAPAGSVAGTIL